MGRTLKTTTAMLACLNLAAPHAALAQSSESMAIQEAVEACREPNSDACLSATQRALEARGAASEEGVDGDPLADATAESEAEPVDAPTESADGTVPADTAPTEAPLEQPAETVTETPAETATDATDAPAETATDAPAEAPAEISPAEAETATPEVSTDGSSAEAVQDPPSEDEAQAEAPANPAQTEADGADATETPPADTGTAATQVETPSAEEGDTTTTDAPATNAPAPSDEAEPMPEQAEAAEQAGGDDPAATTEEPAEATPDPETAAETDDAPATGEAAGATASEPEQADTTEGEATAEGGEAVSGADTQESTPDGTDAQEEISPAQSADPEPVLSDGQGTEADAMEGGAPEAAAASSGSAEPSDVVSETVTEEDARSSSEDFATAIDRTADGAETAETDDEDGMSALEKALVLGAGALAVGTLLRGNREVVAASDDRVVVTDSSGNYQLIKDDNTLLQRPGTEVQTETFDDGSTRTIVNRDDGSRIVTIRDSSLRVLRRERITPDGERILLIDDTQETAPVDLANLRAYEPQVVVTGASDEAALREALATQGGFDRAYSLAQVRNISEVRTQVPAIDLDNITFESGSAAISPEEADELTALGRVIRDRIAEDPGEIFLVEGHTDAVGDAPYNLALSDRRAESVALALSEYFDVPPENLIVQGYGESFLKVPTEAAERANRRATVRRITPLLQVAAAQ